MSELLTVQQIRELFDQRKRAIEDVEMSLPGLEILDSQLAVKELSPAEAEHVDKLAMKNGETSQSREWAALICKALVTRIEPHQRIFSDKDVEHVSKYGATILMPLVLQIRQHSKLNVDAIEDMKKNLKKTPES